MTEKTIVEVIGKDRIIAGHPIVCPNVSHLLKGQQDMISVTKSGMLIEYEVKISRSDFHRDAKKNKSFSYCNPHLYPDKVPNQFYYVVPIGLVDIDEVPLWAGLIYVTDKNVMYSKKAAPILHRHKHDLAKIYLKVATLYQQRHFIGCCLLTHKNKGIKERNRVRALQHEETRKKNTEAILNFKKK